MTPKEFERLSREERQETLKFVADRDGIESGLYRKLAAKHGCSSLGSGNLNYRRTTHDIR
jgi:hypothetical protein